MKQILKTSKVVGRSDKMRVLKRWDRKLLRWPARTPQQADGWLCFETRGEKRRKHYRAQLDWLNFFLAEVRGGLGPYSGSSC